MWCDGAVGAVSVAADGASSSDTFAVAGFRIRLSALAEGLQQGGVEADGIGSHGVRSAGVVCHGDAVAAEAPHLRCAAVGMVA